MVSERKSYPEAYCAEWTNAMIFVLAVVYDSALKNDETYTKDEVAEEKQKLHRSFQMLSCKDN